eukprot:CFRG5512T1
MKRNSNSFGSFGAIHGLNHELLENTQFEDDWKALEDNTRTLLNLRKTYRDTVESMTRTQVNIKSNLNSYNSSIAELEGGVQCSQIDERQKRKVSRGLQDKKRLASEVEKFLPKKSSLLLRLAIGDVNVTLPKLGDRILYKTAYEDFKLRMTFVAMSFMAISIIFRLNGIRHRPLMFLFQVFLVWYYSTITLREHILIANGSKIRQWWLWHHYLSIVVVCLLVIWPDGYTIHTFYSSFDWFCFYVGFIQLLEFQYQRRRMYTLNALGKQDNMAPIGEGFSWNSSLSVLIPFVLFGQVWQLLNGYILLRLSQHPECVEWQVSALCALFFILGIGNLYTTLTSVKHKLGSFNRLRSLPEVNVCHHDDETK